MKRKSDDITQLEYFKWGAKNHPGDKTYIFFILMTWGCAMKNKDITSGIIAAMVVSIIFCVTFVLSSISIGRANRKIIIAEEVKNESGGQ